MEEKELYKRVAELEKMKKNLTPEQQREIEKDFLIQAVFESNALEGNPMTLEEVRELLNNEST